MTRDSSYHQQQSTQISSDAFTLELLSHSEETFISLCGTIEPGPTGNSSSKERTSSWPDMEESEGAGLPTLWGEEGTQGGEGDRESTEGLKWAWEWPVNRNGEWRWEEEAGERGGAGLEEDEGWAAVGGRWEWTLWLPLLSACKGETLWSNAVAWKKAVWQKTLKETNCTKMSPGALIQTCSAL